MDIVKTFGVKEKNTVYTDREGVYAIVIQDDKVATLKTHSGRYFLIGGGIEEGETKLECIERESIEESGYSILVKDFIGTADYYFKHETLGPFHPIGHFYTGKFKEKMSNRTEDDSDFVWLGVNELDKLFLTTQRWAVEMALKSR